MSTIKATWPRGRGTQGDPECFSRPWLGNCRDVEEAGGNSLVLKQRAWGY